MIEDTFKHQGLRHKLVNEIRQKGISDEAVLRAINIVKRHLFMDSGFVQYAYRDNAFPIAAGQTISQPSTVAYQTHLLNVKKLDKILEVGTGSGYQAAILCELGANLFTIERQRELYNYAKILLPKLGYLPSCFYGDGCEGLPTYAPFDKILITASAPKVPEALKRQLKIGGRLVMPVGSTKHQSMKLIIRKSETEFIEEDNGSFVFVPLLGGISK